MTARPSVSANKLRDFIESHSDDLLRSLRLYALRAGLAKPNNAEQVASELLSEVVVEALEHADRFDSSRHPRSWLLGIGANMIRRRTTDRTKRERREPLVRDMYGHIEAAMSDGELFEQVTQIALNDESDLESRETIDMLLADLNEEDRQVIQLAILYDLDGARLAEALGVKPGAARMRLHRALRRLRSAHHVEPND